MVRVCSRGVEKANRRRGVEQPFEHVAERSDFAPRDVLETRPHRSAYVTDGFAPGRTSYRRRSGRAGDVVGGGENLV
jgi:hypothetical protein